MVPSREIDALPSKTVGRRQEGAATAESADILLKTAWALRGGVGLAPRGLFRFASFEEAQEWMSRQMSQRFARRRSRTFADSVAPLREPKRATS